MTEPLDLPPLRTLFFEDLGDTVVVTVKVAELIGEKSRARLSCVCKVGREVVLDGEALVKVPSGQGRRPVMRL